MPQTHFASLNASKSIAFNIEAFREVNSPLNGFLSYLRRKFSFEASREESLTARQQNLKFCFGGILEGTFNFEASR